jgi:hypothetical protein
MQRSDAVVVVLAAALGAGVAGADESTFTVTSEPSGARVWSIIGELGTTPLRVGERSIYPNRFPEDRIDEYGKLFVGHPGCVTLAHAVTLEDVAAGVTFTLDCRSRVGGVAVEDLDAVRPAGRDTTGATPEMAERRLRQLRLLDELLEEGIISAEEERSIRRRLLSP